MKCRKCGQTASINMLQHRLSLCKNHYLDWFLEQTESTIHRHQMLDKNSKVLVAVSGGKDSLALWDVLHRLGYQADGMYIHLGIDDASGYSHQSETYTQQFADANGLKLHIVHVKEVAGRSVTELVQTGRQGTDRPCSVCGLVKRRIINTYPREHGYDTVATGHNLDDEVAVLFSNNLNWKLDQLRRQQPVLPASGAFIRKVKPFVRFYERETAAYTLMRGIEYIEDECPFSVGSTNNEYKVLFNQLEKEHAGVKLAYYSRFLQEIKTGFLNVPESQSMDDHVCPNCGEPTTSAGDCAYCRLIQRQDQAVSR